MYHNLPAGIQKMDHHHHESYENGMQGVSSISVGFTGEMTPAISHHVVQIEGHGMTPQMKEEDSDITSQTPAAIKLLCAHLSQNEDMDFAGANSSTAQSRMNDAEVTRTSQVDEQQPSNFDRWHSVGCLPDEESTRAAGCPSDRRDAGPSHLSQSQPWLIGDRRWSLADIHARISPHSRTIETQTYPDVRVIETQTSQNQHPTATQTRSCWQANEQFGITSPRQQTEVPNVTMGRLPYYSGLDVMTGVASGRDSLTGHASTIPGTVESSDTVIGHVSQNARSVSLSGREVDGAVCGIPVHNLSVSASQLTHSMPHDRLRSSTTYQTELPSNSAWSQLRSHDQYHDIGEENLSWSDQYELDIADSSFANRHQPQMRRRLYDDEVYESDRNRHLSRNVTENLPASRFSHGTFGQQSSEWLQDVAIMVGNQAAPSVMPGDVSSDHLHRDVGWHPPVHYHALQHDWMHNHRQSLLIPEAIGNASSHDFVDESQLLLSSDEEDTGRSHPIVDVVSDAGSELEDDKYLNGKKLKYTADCTDNSTKTKSILRKYHMKKALRDKKVTHKEHYRNVATQYEDGIVSSPQLVAGFPAPNALTQEDESMTHDSGVIDNDNVSSLAAFSRQGDVSFVSSTRSDKSTGTDVGAAASMWDDELERLRRERQRIIDMLARDIIPSRIQVELAEAQLNYLIGQTDVLLQTVDEPLLSGYSSWRQSVGERLGGVEFLAQYRTRLVESQHYIEDQIRQLESTRKQNIEQVAAEMSSNGSFSDVRGTSMLGDTGSVQHTEHVRLDPRAAQSNAEACKPSSWSPSDWEQFLIGLRREIVSATLPQSTPNTASASGQQSPINRRSGVKRRSLNFRRSPAAGFQMRNSNASLTVSQNDSVSEERQTIEFDSPMSSSTRAPSGHRHNRLRRSSVTPSLEEEMRDLLQECQEARQRAQVEIGRAMEALRRTSPAWTCFPPNTSRRNTSGSSFQHCMPQHRNTDMSATPADSTGSYSLYSDLSPEHRHHNWPFTLANCRLSASHGALQHAGLDTAETRWCSSASVSDGQRRRYSFGTARLHGNRPSPPSYFHSVLTPQRLSVESDLAARPHSISRPPSSTLSHSLPRRQQAPDTRSSYLQSSSFMDQEYRPSSTAQSRTRRMERDHLAPTVDQMAVQQPRNSSSRSTNSTRTRETK